MTVPVTVTVHCSYNSCGLSSTVPECKSDEWCKVKQARAHAQFVNVPPPAEVAAAVVAAATCQCSRHQQMITKLQTNMPVTGRISQCSHGMQVSCITP